MMVRLGLSIKNSELNLGRKIGKSAHLW